MTAFGDGAFKEVIKVKEAQIPQDRALIIRGRDNRGTSGSLRGKAG